MLKKIKGFLKKNNKIILSVVVILALLIACISSVVEDRKKVTKDKGRVVSITPLYDEPAMVSTFARTPYESLDLTQKALDSSGFINEDVGAFNGEKTLTEQEKKDKAALEALLASNNRSDDSLSKGDESRKRREKYKLNTLANVNKSSTVTFSANPGGGGAPAMYANSSNGTYLGQFVLTGYCPCVICCGKTNGITASGRQAVANHTIAADRRFAFGTQMIINGVVYTVDDRGGAITGNHIDIFFNTHAEALAFGKRTGDVYLYTGGGTTVADNSSNNNSTNTTQPSTGSGSVSLIGDSLTVGATSAFQSLLPSAKIDGKVGRQMSAGQGIVESMKASGTLGDKVIIELGTNGTFTEAAGQSLIDSIGSDKQIYWMNTYGPSLSWYSDVNSVISTLCTKNSNVSLINWESTGLAHPEYFSGDGIHLTSAGYQAFAQLMYNAVK